jgi:hypothetical protein
MCVFWCLARAIDFNMADELVIEILEFLSGPPHDELRLGLRFNEVITVSLAVNRNRGWKRFINPNGPTLMVVYALLPDSWRCGKPKNEIRDAYLCRLGDAVQAFNRVRVWPACRRCCDAMPCVVTSAVM